MCYSNPRLAPFYLKHTTPVNSHYVHLVCSLYETARNPMLSMIYSKFPRISSLDLCNKFILLMSQGCVVGIRIV